MEPSFYLRHFAHTVVGIKTRHFDHNSSIKSYYTALRLDPVSEQPSPSRINCRSIKWILKFNGPQTWSVIKRPKNFLVTKKQYSFDCDTLEWGGGFTAPEILVINKYETCTSFLWWPVLGKPWIVPFFHRQASQFSH